MARVVAETEAQKPPATIPAATAPRDRPPPASPSLSLPPNESELVAGIVYDGDIRELLRLWIKTTGLTILTFGFYRFWGRTRIRRYLWSRVSLLGDRFEYDGTGRELFMRFLLTVTVVLLPVAAIGVALEFSGLDADTVWLATHSEFLVAAFLSLAGRYFGQRYRLSRSLWRGLRGGLDGNAWIYALRAAGLTLLQILTLGFSRPWLYAGLWRYEARNTRLGSRRFGFEGSGGKIFWTWAATLVLGVCAMIAFAFLLAMIVAMMIGIMMLIGAMGRGQIPKFDFRLVASGVSAYVVYVVALGAVWTIVTSAFERRWMVYSIGATVLGDIRLRLDAEVREVCWFRIGNFLLTILTLNLAWPIVAHRTLAFYSRALRLDAQGFERLSQTEAPSLPPASGLAELFDTAGFA